MRIRELLLGISVALLITSAGASNVDGGAGAAGAWPLEEDGKTPLFMHPASLGVPMTPMIGVALEDDGWVKISGFTATQYVPNEGEETSPLTADELRERFPVDCDLILSGDMWVMNDPAPEEGRPTLQLSTFAERLEKYGNTCLCVRCSDRTVKFTVPDYTTHGFSLPRGAGFVCTPDGSNFEEVSVTWLADYVRREELVLPCVVFAHALPAELGELGLTGSETAAVMWQALEGDEDGVFALVRAALRNCPRWTEAEREIVGDDYFNAPGVIEGCVARAQELTSEILSQLARGKTEELDALREARDRCEADIARWGVFMEDTRRHLAAAAPDIEARVFDPLMEVLRASAHAGTTDSAWVVPHEKWDDLVAAWLEFGNEGVLEEDEASADEGGE